MFGKLLSTQNDFSLLILRVLFGAVMWPHGAQKLLGMFPPQNPPPNYGYSFFIDLLNAKLGLPWAIAFLVIIIEFFGAIALFLGFFTRLMALGFISVMVGGAYILHHSFFVGKYGYGYEYHIIAIAICLVLLIKGGGMASVDGMIAKKLRS